MAHLPLGRHAGPPVCHWLRPDLGDEHARTVGDARVRTVLFTPLQRLPLRFFDRTPVGTLMARNTNDVGALMMALVLWYGGHQVLEGRLEWGVLVAMLQYVPRFFMPIRNKAKRYGAVQSARASSERMFEPLDAKPEHEGRAYRPEDVRGQIKFQDVWFSYFPSADALRYAAEGAVTSLGTPQDTPGQAPHWVLEGASFRVEPGQSLAIVRATGAGKSTIVNLVCRFYPIQEGRILVEGVDIREWDVETLRLRVSVV